MKITWLGHSGFRLEIGGEVLLIDPWLRGAPSFDEARFDEAVAGATALLLTHGHFDHASNAVEIAKAAGVKLHGMFDMVGWLAEQGGVEAVGFNKGGTIEIGDVRVTMTHAVHSSSQMVDGRPVYLGGEAGFMIRGEGRTLYFAGDTDVFSDMAILQELHRPEIGVLPIGGHFTMDAERAAYACRKFFDFREVIPCHYATFPLLAQSAEPFARAVAPTRTRVLEVMAPQAL
jgi:L-ascorbate metabolism protein UlaG (beta-lactamase superfamily)